MASLLKRIIRKILVPEKGRILMLHRVISNYGILDENKAIELTPDNLEKTIISFKKKKYDLVSLDEALRRIKSSKRYHKFVCFTLDDGYVDNFDNAYPLFKKYTCPFTINITTDIIESKAFVWWYVLENLIVNNNQLNLSDGTSYSTVSLQEKNTVFSILRDRLFRLPQHEVESTFRQWFCQYEFENPIRQVALNCEQIKTMASNPLCTIASHSVTHPVLPKLSRDEQFDELKRSKEILERITGKPIQHFAYPYGFYDEKTIAVLHELGYESAMITWGGAIRKNDNDVYRLKRIEIKNQIK